MSSDQLGAATIGYAPGSQWPIDVDWHYGFGQWIECPSVPFDCSTTARVSSAGAYGAYPFIDFERQYFGIVAREGTFASGYEGYKIWSDVESELAQWATENL